MHILPIYTYACMHANKRVHICTLSCLHAFLNEKNRNSSFHSNIECFLKLAFFVFIMKRFQKYIFETYFSLFLKKNNSETCKIIFLNYGYLTNVHLLQMFALKTKILSFMYMSDLDRYLKKKTLCIRY